MTKRRYHQVVDDEWIAPKRNRYVDRCCDCGLVHIMHFRLAKTNKDGSKSRRAQIQFKAVRDGRSTAAIRRAFQFTKE